MSFRAPILRIFTLAAILPLALSGCISVFPKTKPVQLYRFGEAATAPASSGRPAVTVLKGATTFPPAASGDRLLTTTGSESAYIGGARWVAPASIMFDDTLMRAFDAPGSVRLVERGEPLVAASTLRLDVRAFEARYPGPTVAIQVRATLIRNADRTLIAEKMFEADVPATDNRQAPIVAAYDSATTKVIADIRDWTTQTAPR
jgi:cholesterol transport system auxiliary component